ncbi:MAG: ribosomal protein S18-alanine N-acetyltransferase [Vulcanimicrobiota bacterium]
MTVEAMRVEDIEQVRAIELASFETTWSPEAFTTELRHNQAAHYLVLREHGQVRGYCGIWLVADEAHVTSIAIAPDCRGRGQGKLLMLRMLELARGLGAHWVTLEVRADNHAALSMYRKFGFARVAVRKAYYQQKIDAVVMWAGNLHSQSYTRRLTDIERSLQAVTSDSCH